MAFINLAFKKCARNLNQLGLGLREDVRSGSHCDALRPIGRRDHFQSGG